MMKKTVSSILLASALLLGTVAPVAANAATVTGTSGSTKTQAAFTAPDSVTTPVDPNNPDTSSTGDNGGNGATTSEGGLTFLYVTDSIDFGSAKAVTTKTQSLDVDTISTGSFTADKTINSNFVTELSDTRGSNAGWHVTVSSSPMVNAKDTDANTNTLKGATVDFDGPTTIKNSASADGISANTVSVPTETGAAQTIYQAAADNGAGQTSFQLAPTNIKLNNIGPNTNTGTYNGSLTWTLDDAPVEPAK
ncbi:WxL domain-containing protein [Levilactobacillus yiduensis]|uniref:WxL domain-containing protein n=1 Tax=Levilactobacillus yiduensis TaxID=2953880 RepID=UPI000EF34F47|nr:WxL domain-containing protein [Levilactobacillus yiduensis]AYM01822.1 WxL domain-containing protein [Levilactobacillus brevis]